MRTLIIMAAVFMLTGCTTTNVGPASDATAANLPQPRTPDVFRKPPPQVGRWGNGVGYGGRY